jgi:hypothetical protein
MGILGKCFENSKAYGTLADPWNVGYNTEMMKGESPPVSRRCVLLFGIAKRTVTKGLW